MSVQLTALFLLGAIVTEQRFQNILSVGTTSHKHSRNIIFLRIDDYAVLVQEQIARIVIWSHHVAEVVNAILQTVHHHRVIRIVILHRSRIMRVVVVNVQHYDHRAFQRLLVVGKNPAAVSLLPAAILVLAYHIVELGIGVRPLYVGVNACHERLRLLTQPIKPVNSDILQSFLILIIGNVKRLRLERTVGKLARIVEAFITEAHSFGVELLRKVAYVQT